MVSLYSDPNWSQHMKTLEQNIYQSLISSEWNLSKISEKLLQHYKDETNSLTNLWAYVLISKITNEFNEDKLSSLKAACENGNNPYPIYSAVEKRNIEKKKWNNPDTWFEFTPHRSGFPAFKYYVDSQHLGNPFKKGKQLENIVDRDLCYLQGLWGSALGSQEKIKEFLYDYILQLLPFRPCQMRSKNAGLAAEGIPTKCNGCIEIDKLLERNNNLNHQGVDELACYLSNEIEEILKGEPGLQLSEHQNLQVLLKWPSSSECYNFLKMIYEFLRLLKKWEWGKTHNYLYHLEVSENIPKEILDEKYLYLIDGGLEINSAYPLILPPHREVDLILSFDFSEGDPFQTLKSTADYCKKNDIPFPKIQISKEKTLRSCYIFGEQEDGVPVVMHFPLFNNQNCGDAVQDWVKRYQTLHLFYKESDIEDLLRVSKLNVQLSKDQILKTLKLVYDRKEIKTI